MAASPAHSFASYPSLRDTSVIVTGGASGIGMEIVRAFAGQGSRVGFLDFDVEHGERLASELQSAGGRVRFEPCDLFEGQGDAGVVRNADDIFDRADIWQLPRAREADRRR